MIPRRQWMWWCGLIGMLLPVLMLGLKHRGWNLLFWLAWHPLSFTSCFFCLMGIIGYLLVSGDHTERLSGALAGCVVSFVVSFLLLLIPLALISSMIGG